MGQAPPAASPPGLSTGDSTALPGTGARLAGRAEDRAGTGCGLPQVDSAQPDRAGPGRRVRGGGPRPAERESAGQREGADWAPPAGEQTGFHRRPVPRPSPLPSAGPLPLPSLGVGRCAWHIPHILPPVSSARPPLPSPAPRGCWRNQGRGSPRRAQSKFQKTLPRWKTSRQIPSGLRP